MWLFGNGQTWYQVLEKTLQSGAQTLFDMFVTFSNDPAEYIKSGFTEISEVIHEYPYLSTISASLAVLTLYCARKSRIGDLNIELNTVFGGIRVGGYLGKRPGAK